MVQKKEEGINDPKEMNRIEVFKIDLLINYLQHQLKILGKRRLELENEFKILIKK